MNLLIESGVLAVLTIGAGVVEAVQKLKNKLNFIYNLKILPFMAFCVVSVVLLILSLIEDTGEDVVSFFWGSIGFVEVPFSL